MIKGLEASSQSRSGKKKLMKVCFCLLLNSLPKLLAVSIKAFI